MHAASVALVLHGVLLTSLAGLIIRSNFSAQTLLLIGLLLNIYPKLLSYVQIPPGSNQELFHSVEDARAPIIGVKQASIHNEAPYSEDCTDNFDHQSRSTAALVNDPRCGFTSITDEGTSTILAAESLRTPRRKFRKSVRDCRMFDDDKENEPSPLMARGATLSTPHRNGLRPLTLTNNPSLDVRGSFGPRRTVSLSNGPKRLSPLFYVSDASREHSHPARSAEVSARRVSLPLDGLSRIGKDVTARLPGEIQLTSKLQEEMKLTARLRNDLVELRDRACVELNQSKHEAQALAFAVDARECFIKDLAASVEFLRVKNKILKKATRRDLCQDVPTEVFIEKNIDETIQCFSPKIITRELEQGNDNLGNVITQQPGGLKSVQELRLGQHCVKHSTIASGDLSWFGWDLGEHGSSRDTASWLSLGTVSEPTLESPHSSGALIQALPSTFTTDNEEYCEYATDAPDTYFEVEFPTISAEVPPCHAAAIARRKSTIVPKGITIYEVDGRALVSYHDYLLLPQHAKDLAFSGCSMHQANTRHSPRHLMKESSNTICPGSNQTRHEASCLAILEDSPFYAVPASAFIVPRVCPLSG